MPEPERGDLDEHTGSPRRDRKSPTEAQKAAEHPSQGPREARPMKHETRGPHDEP